MKNREKEDLLEDIKKSYSHLQYQKAFQERLVSLLAEDKARNTDLLRYTNNRKLTSPQDSSIQEIEKQLGIENLGIENENIKEKSSTEKTKGSIKNIIGQVRNFEKRNKDTIENYEASKLHFSPKAQATIKAIEEESGHKVKIIIDKELTENFRSIMGISYRGGGYLGQYVVVDDPKVLEDETFLRHEAIHCMQQRDLGFGKANTLGFIRWLAISFTSLGLKYLKIPGLDEAMDYGTDNQVTDFETYLNQFSKGYLKTRPAGAWKKYRNAEFRKQEMNRFKREEIDNLKNNLHNLESTLQKTETRQERKELEREIKQKQSDIDQYEKVYENLKNMDEVLVVMIKSDVQEHKKNDTREQVYFESKKNREIRLPIENFIQKHGAKENNYKEGVDTLLKIKEYIQYDTLLQTHTREEVNALERDIMKFINKHGEGNMQKYDIKKFLDK